MRDRCGDYRRVYWPEGPEVQAAFVDAIREMLGLESLPKMQKKASKGGKYAKARRAIAA